MLKEQLEKLGVPDVLGEPGCTKEQWPARRREIIKVLCEEEYGFLPPEPESMEYEVSTVEKDFCAGKVTLSKALIKNRLKQGVFTFPVFCAVPNQGQQFPAFIHINFRSDVPDRYMPTEEVCDNGFAVFSFNYQDVTRDGEGDFAGGLSEILFGSRPRKSNDCGKIALWAWAAQRVMDYVQTLHNIDKNNIAVVGHSRLGKTALLAGGLDERFSHVISNDSGCSGASVTREKTGEHVKDIFDRFPYWFCENYKKYAGHESEMPFDQHFLLALTAPRKLYVASAEQDSWADPASEYLACVAADSVWKLFDAKGFVYPDRLPLTGEVFHLGDIGYHVRPGTHYFSRLDWQYYMDFMKKTHIS